MATNRPTGYGLSRELAEKNAAKYSVDDEVSIKMLMIILRDKKPNLSFELHCLKPFFDGFPGFIEENQTMKQEKCFSKDFTINFMQVRQFTPTMNHKFKFLACKT